MLEKAADLLIDVVMIVRCETCGCIVVGAQVNAVASDVAEPFRSGEPLPVVRLYDAVRAIGRKLGGLRSPLPSQVGGLVAAIGQLPTDCRYCEHLTTNYRGA